MQTLASRDNMLFVAVGLHQDERKPDPTRPRDSKHSKLAITQAILQLPLARTCVLGATLAFDLLDATAPSPVPVPPPQPPKS